MTTAALGAKRQAKATSCLANLKQIETGIRLYENDFDDYWPPYPLLSSDADVPAFKRSLASYKLSEPLWYCPLDSKAKTNYPSEWGSHEHWSYELSLGFALQAHNIQTPKGPISRSGLADPAGTWMLSDQTEIVQPSTRLSAHGDRVNVMFADGHAKSMPVVKL